MIIPANQRQNDALLGVKELKQALRVVVKVLKDKGMPDAVIGLFESSAERTISRRLGMIKRYKELKEKGISTLDEITDILDRGRILVEARIASGISQAEVAKILKVSQARVVHYEKTCYYGITANRVQRILKILGLDAQMTVSPLKKGSTKSGKIKRRTHGKEGV